MADTGAGTNDTCMDGVVSPAGQVCNPPDRYRSLVAAAVVVGQLVADDSIALLGFELDLDWPDEQLD